MKPAPRASTGVAPRARRPRASTQKKLDHLLTKAAALIAKKGFEAMTMRDLSQEIDVSLAGLYHYFSSKEDLLYQLQYRTFLRLHEEQEQLSAEPGTPEERFRRMLVGHLSFHARHTNELKACTFELESLSGEPYERVEAIRRRYYELMTGVVAAVINGRPNGTRPSRESRHKTLFIFGMLNWIFMWYDPARHGPVENIGKEMYDLVLNGLRRAPKSP